MSHSKPLPRPFTSSPNATTPGARAGLPAATPAKPATAPAKPAAPPVAKPMVPSGPGAATRPPVAAPAAPRVALPAAPAIAKSSDVGILQAKPGEQVHLLAGQLYFGNTAARVHTLLGSCVAITLWNPSRRIGGMCHFLLPNRVRTPGMPRDGRFGEESLEMLVEALTKAGTKPQDYTVHLYGGADTMPDTQGIKLNVGERNIEQGWTLIDHYGFNLENVDVGDHVPRNVSMTFHDGEVVMRRGRSMKTR